MSFAAWVAVLVVGFVVVAFVARRGVAADPHAEPPSEARLRELLGQGRKIEAIRMYRQLHGCGLKEAKDAVDALEKAQG